MWLCLSVVVCGPSLSFFLSWFGFTLFFSRFFLVSVVSVEQWFPCRWLPEAPPCLFCFSLPLNRCLCLLLSVAPLSQAVLQKPPDHKEKIIICKILYPLLAGESSQAVLHNRTSFLLTPVSLALPGYNWGHSQLAFHQREYLAPRPARFIFARVKRSTLRAGVHPTFAGIEPLSLSLSASAASIYAVE